MSFRPAALLAGLALGGCVQADQASFEPGTVLAASPIDQPGENSGAGAIAGMALLGAAGGAVGQGAGKAAAVIGGIIAGEVAGSAVEAAEQPRDGVAYTIRLAGGQVVTVTEHLSAGDRVFAAGAPVTLETNGHEQIVLAAGSAP